ncbi:MAG: DUF2089 domain-containing protein [Bacillota bacterium]|nr:DUF2089 domain-containing protein [Bacillota bacterium]
MIIEKYIAPSTCPVCGGEYEITRLTCKKCNSELTGKFEGCEFCDLSPNEKQFLLTFIKCRGNIKEVEKELNISYPTVRNRLDAIISRLGLEGIKPDTSQERKEVLEKLEKGEITADEAAELIKAIIK